MAPCGARREDERWGGVEAREKYLAVSNKSGVARKAWDSATGGEGYDLQTGTIGHQGEGVIAREDRDLIEFDHHGFAGQAEGFEQGGEGDGSGEWVSGAVENDGHGVISTG